MFKWTNLNKNYVQINNMKDTILCHLYDPNAGHWTPQEQWRSDLYQERRTAGPDWEWLPRTTQVRQTMWDLSYSFHWRAWIQTYFFLFFRYDQRVASSQHDLRGSDEDRSRDNGESATEVNIQILGSTICMNIFWQRYCTDLCCCLPTLFNTYFRNLAVWCSPSVLILLSWFGWSCPPDPLLCSWGSGKFQGVRRVLQ